MDTNRHNCHHCNQFRDKFKDKCQNNIPVILILPPSYILKTSTKCTRYIVLKPTNVWVLKFFRMTPQHFVGHLVHLQSIDNKEFAVNN